jgi:hypothetical protein
MSRSRQRHTFQARHANSDEFTNIMENIRNQDLLRDDDLEWQKNNMEYDLRTTDWILEKVRKSKSYSQNLYAAMCNNEFTKNDVWPILTEKRWSRSWRSAGGIIADMQEKGDYVDWYCSGIKNNENLDDEQFRELTKEQQEFYLKMKAYVSESDVTDEIREDLLKLGWIVIDEDSES